MKESSVRFLLKFFSMRFRVSNTDRIWICFCLQVFPRHCIVLHNNLRKHWAQEELSSDQLLLLFFRKLNKGRQTWFALEALSASDSFGEKLLLQLGGSGNSFFFVLILELRIDPVHHPKVEFMAILVHFPFKSSWLFFNKVHDFEGRNCNILFFPQHAFVKVAKLGDQPVSTATRICEQLLWVHDNVDKNRMMKHNLQDRIGIAECERLLSMGITIHFRTRLKACLLSIAHLS